MAAPSYTYTLTNGTTADASQVMQDLNDILNGVTDGTKDLSFAALTCSGNVTLNGTTNTIGSASNDDLVVTASLASTIAIKTTNTYNIGSSTLGLAGVYLGANSQTVRLVGSSSMSATWTFTFPVTAGSDRQFLETNGSGVTAWRTIRRNCGGIYNIAVDATVAASAMTITLYGADGNALSSTNVTDIVFRSTTAGAGTPTLTSDTAVTALVIPNTALMGHASAVAHYIYVYAILNSGDIELAVSSSLFDEGTLVSTSAIGTSSDSGATMYSNSARTNVPLRLLARVKSTQAVAGTWDTAPSEISLYPFDKTSVAAYYTTVAGQSIDNANFEFIDFGTKVIDYRNAVTTGADWKYTVQEAGVYHVDMGCTITSGAGWDAGEEAYVAIYKTGAALHIVDSVFLDSTNSNALFLGGSVKFNCAVGDYIQGGVYQESGAARALSTTAVRKSYISIEKVGDL